MINIFCNTHDISIDYILDWLEYYKVPYKRYNSSTFFDNYYPLIYPSNRNRLYNKQLFWFYKWSHNPSYIPISDNEELSNNIYNNLRAERDILFDIFWDFIPKNNIINHPKFVDVNKYTQLTIAENIGLEIPNTILTRNKIDLINFCKKNKRIITKNFNSGFFIHSNDGTSYCNYSNILKNEDINKLSDIFFPSLFQEKIDRQFELKIIYIGGDVYPVALLSDDKDEDIRISKKNKTFPCKIPLELKSKLILLMNKLNLDFGTIDMIYNNNSEYVFLEVNPSGQFLGYSNNCNYMIEEKIAKFLKYRLNKL
jgi:hypothetical protein